MPTFPWVESECGHYGSLFGVFGASGGRVALFGVCNHLRVQVPKAPSLAKAFARLSRKIGKPAGGEASPVRQAWEGMPLPRPSLRSH